MGERTILSIINCLLSLAGLVLYAVALATRNWMFASFTLPMPPPINGLAVTDNMGLFENCKEIQYPNNPTTDCNGEGAKDWQYIAAGCGIAGVALGGITALTSFLTVGVLPVCLFCKGNNKLRTVSAVLAFLAGIGMAITVVLYGYNYKFQVDPRLEFYVDFEPDWSFKVAASGVGVYGLVGLFTVIDFIKSSYTGVSLKDSGGNVAMNSL